MKWILLATMLTWSPDMPNYRWQWSSRAGDTMVKLGDNYNSEEECRKDGAEYLRILRDTSFPTRVFCAIEIESLQ